MQLALSAADCVVALDPTLASFADRRMHVVGDRGGAPLEACANISVASLFREHSIDASMRFSAERHMVDLRQFGAFDYRPVQRELSLRRESDRPEWLAELVLGPALLYALAHQQVFALHASALRLGVDPEAPAVALIAASGTGKSTVASAAHTLGWERLADDVLPLALAGAQHIELRPHFPQLKLPAAAQYPETAAARVPLRALIRLERGERERIEPLSPRAAADLVLANTLASRLFPPACLASHLQLVAAVASAVADRRLAALRLVVADRSNNVPGAARSALDLLARSGLQ